MPLGAKRHHISLGATTQPDVPSTMISKSCKFDPPPIPTSDRGNFQDYVMVLPSRVLSRLGTGPGMKALMCRTAGQRISTRIEEKQTLGNN